MDICVLWLTSVFTITLVIWVLLFAVNTQKAAFVCSTTDLLGVLYQVILVQAHRFLQHRRSSVFCILATDVGASLLKQI